MRQIESGRFKTIYTRIAGVLHFYPAEEYHQLYHKKIRFAIAFIEPAAAGIGV